MSLYLLLSIIIIISIVYYFFLINNAAAFLPFHIFLFEFLTPLQPAFKEKDRRTRRTRGQGREGEADDPSCGLGASSSQTAVLVVGAPFNETDR